MHNVNHCATPQESEKLAGRHSRFIPYMTKDYLTTSSTGFKDWSRKV